MRVLTPFERFCERVFDLYFRWAELGRMVSPERFPGGLRAMRVDYHAITPACALVARTNEPAALAADQQSVRARAAVSRKHKPTRRLILFYWVLGIAAIAYLVGGPIVMLSMTADVAAYILYGALLLPLLAFLLCMFAVNVGRHICLRHAMQQWGERLGGESGFDEVDPVVTWIGRYWPWFTPPHFLSSESTWATGWRDERPVLLISERQDSWMISSTMNYAAQGLADPDAERHLEIPATILCRFSVFVAGGALRADPEAQGAVQELASWGYGVLSTPAGLYLYGLAYERALKPQYLSRVIDKVFAAMPPAEAPALSGTKEG